MWFPPHDSGTVNVFLTVFVLSSAHECTHASVSATCVYHSAFGLRMASNQQNVACSLVDGRTQNLLPLCKGNWERFMEHILLVKSFWDGQSSSRQPAAWRDQSRKATHVTHHVMLKPYGKLSFGVRENLCEEWEQRNIPRSTLHDVSHGRLKFCACRLKITQ